MCCAVPEMKLMSTKKLMEGKSQCQGLQSSASIVSEHLQKRFSLALLVYPPRRVRCIPYNSISRQHELGDAAGDALNNNWPNTGSCVQGRALL